MSKLLMEDPPLMVQPSLACAIGLNEALVLQQVHYWLQRSTTEIGDHRWVYNTVDEWREQFPFWSMDTVRRTIANLKEKGLLISARLSANKFDRTAYYRIDREILAAIEDGNLQSSKVASAPDHCELQPSEGGILQPSEGGNLQPSLYKTETTKDYTETTGGEAPLASPAAKSEPVQADLLRDQAERPSTEKKRKDKKPEAFDAMAYLLASGVDQQVAADHLVVRKQKKQPPTETAFKGMKREGAKVGLSFAETVTYCAERSWAGFYRETYLKDAHATPGVPAQRSSFMTKQERIDAVNAANRAERESRFGRPGHSVIDVTPTLPQSPRLPSNGHFDDVGF